MPRKHTLPAEFTSWIDELPEETRATVREKLEASPAYTRMAGLQKLATESAQRAAKAEQYAQQWDSFAQTSPILKPEVWQQVAPLLNQYRPDELVRRLQPINQDAQLSPQQAAVGLQQTQDEINHLHNLLRSGEKTWEEVEPALGVLAKQVQQFGQIAQDYSRFRNEFVPTFTTGLEAKFQQSERAQRSQLADMQMAHAQMTDYARQYPDRSVREILEHAQTQQLPFLDAARALYGEDDQQDFLNRHTEPLRTENEQLKERLKAFEQRSASLGSGDPGESSMGVPRALNVFTRPGRRTQPDNQHAPLPVPRSDREVREQTLNVLRNFDNRV